MLIDKINSFATLDTSTGEFIATKPTGKRKVGDPVGKRDARGRVFIEIGGVRYARPRLVILVMNGFLPARTEPLNGIVGDDRPENIRVLDKSDGEPTYRRKSRRVDNTSGWPGIFYHKPSGNWQATITVDGERKTLGYFSTQTEANNARLSAENKLTTPKPLKLPISRDRLDQLLAYSQGEGVFRWRVQRRGTHGIGSVAGTMNKSGEWYIRVDGQNYKRGRLVVLHTAGYLPDVISHKNNNLADDTLENILVKDLTSHIS